MNPAKPVVTMLVCFIYFAREAAGATSTRRFLRPLLSEGSCDLYLGRVPRRGIALSYPDVIARSEATKQSTLLCSEMDSLCGEMDCFAGARNDDLNPGCLKFE